MDVNEHGNNITLPCQESALRGTSTYTGLDSPSLLQNLVSVFPYRISTML